MTRLSFGPLILGGNVFGWTADHQASLRVLDAFVEHGGSSIDTADSYIQGIPGNSGGQSERIIGEWLAGTKRRENLLILTKVGNFRERPGLSAANIAAAVHDSLRRLRTDYIDLYIAHSDDQGIRQEEYVEAFDQLIRAGKVLEVGASNFSAQRLVGALEIAKSAGLASFTVTQDRWNLVDRDIEMSLIPALVERGLVIVPHSALAKGFLSGKYRPASNVASVRAQQAQVYLDRPWSASLLTALDELAAEHHVSVAAVALAWLRRQFPVAAPIASARSPQQVKELLDCSVLELSREEVALLSRITATG